MVATLALGVAPASASAATSISGMVTDADGHPITTQDVCVELYDHQPYQPPGIFSPTGKSTVSSSDGSWSFSSLAPGTYEFRATDCGISDRNDLPTFYGSPDTAATQVTLADGDAVTGVDIALAAATSISGHIYDGPGLAAPLAGMCVIAADNFTFGAATSETDATGSYALLHLDPSRTYTVDFEPCDISPMLTEYAFWIEAYGGDTPTVLAPTVAHPLTGIDGHLTPTLVITGGPTPGSVTDATTAVFHFSANQYAIGADATFLCALDGAPLATCGSTYSTGELAAGVHALQVQAWSGNVHTPVRTVTWTISPITQPNPGAPTPSPPSTSTTPVVQTSSVLGASTASAAVTVHITSGAGALRRLTKSRLNATLICSSDCSAHGTLTRRGKAVATIATVHGIAGHQLVLRLKATKSQLSTLRRLKSGTFVLHLTITDAAGCNKTTTRTITLR